MCCHIFVMRIFIIKEKQKSKREGEGETVCAYVSFVHVRDDSSEINVRNGELRRIGVVIS